MALSSTGPSPRWSHSLTYDSQRGRTVLFGGTGSGSAQTWEWDGASWTLAAQSGPSPRYAAAMAYDSRRGKTVLFGGSSGVGVDLADTWEWDGSSWTQASVPGPSPRSYHAMAFDAQRGRVVLFGGGPFTPLGDTWEWDGGTWTQVSSSGPAARCRHAMAYDSLRGRTVLLGGINDGTPTETWEWDGASWTLAAQGGVTDRTAHSFSYDTQRGVCVAFGGEFGGASNDTWEWDGIAWVERAIVAPAVALAQTYAVGCGGPAPHMAPVANARPLLGHVQASDITNAPFGFAAVAWGITSQSLPLDFVGAPGCTLLNGAEIEIGSFCQSTSFSTAQHSLAIPYDGTLLGLHVFLQAWVLAPALNPLGIAMSNGLELVIGDT